MISWGKVPRLVLRAEVFALGGERVIFSLPCIVYEHAVGLIDEKHSIQMIAFVLEYDCSKATDGVPAKLVV